jgi:flagellar biosynthesis protein FlhG
MLVTMTDAELAGPPGGRERARRIAVASGKGGVGKTWFAITLGHALAAAGQRVLLFDGDLGLANIDIQLGLTPKHDLGSVLSGGVSLMDAICTCPPVGFDMLAGRSGSGSLASLAPARLDALLSDLGLVPYETILLDLGAGLENNTRRLAAWADTLLVVVTDEPTSLTDAYSVIKLHQSDGPGGHASDVRVVVNQAASQAAGKRTFETLARACQQFLDLTPRLAGVVRRDEHVRDAIRRQTPLLIRHPACHAAEEVRQIAQALKRQSLA